MGIYKNTPNVKLWWRVKDLNLRRQSRGIYSPLPLAARATRQGRTSTAANYGYYEGKGYLRQVGSITA